MIAKFMIRIALFEKFLSSQFIVSVEASSIARFSSKSDELRNISYIGCRAFLKGTHHHLKNGNCNSKIKIVTFIINFGRKISLEMNKCKSKNEASVSEVFALLL